jgi:hypothetical protein
VISRKSVKSARDLAKEAGAILFACGICKIRRIGDFRGRGKLKFREV